MEDSWLEKSVIEFLDDIQDGQAFKDIMSEFKRLNDVEFSFWKATETIHKLMDENIRLKARLELNGIPID